ncbi:hypothetical protein N7537_008697 [Penicillium hordei]|uniref:Uncharacterized protein n=1 Tax=Penicillium hordei TaxID=40994 RepID=A0AAD6E0Y3_9EURO|nr:uncharacterized protein N7537_008697 [Penicillium hordei]KAJ5598613.1 hypothetical protein N7537_008697 [Penicillium hordei]
MKVSTILTAAFASAASAAQYGIYAVGSEASVVLFPNDPTVKVHQWAGESKWRGDLGNPSTTFQSIPSDNYISCVGNVCEATKLPTSFIVELHGEPNPEFDTWAHNYTIREEGTNLVWTIVGDHLECSEPVVSDNQLFRFSES